MPGTPEMHRCTLKDYIEERIRMLREDFCIRLTETEINKMKSLGNEIKVDNYYLQLIMNKM